MQQAQGKELSAFLAFLGFLAAAGITNLGIGYICQVFVTSLIFRCPRIRFVDDLSYLFRAFGITCLENIRKMLFYEGYSASTRKIRRVFRDLLLAEFHFRLHSHATWKLIDYCSRRNSAWYIALNSAVAFPLGWFFALSVMLSNVVNPHLSFGVMCIVQSVGFWSTFLLFVPAFPFVLCMQGKRWNVEFWEVCCKWIAWDLGSHPASKNWWFNDLKTKLKIRPNRTMSEDSRNEYQGTQASVR